MSTSTHGRPIVASARVILATSGTLTGLRAFRGAAGRHEGTEKLL
jgi:hypothetical protein